ncbi:MAG: glycosyltransferase, partial [Sphingobacteriales bacterium]
STDQSTKQANRSKVQNLPHVLYRELEHNIGRSAIRNILADEAQFQSLLFIDADSALPDNSYLKTYKQFPSNPQVLVGGTIYSYQRPTPDKMLRWTYGNEREAKSAKVRSQNPYGSFTLNNLLIDRELYLKFKLDETIKTYGHEDTVFGERLQEEEIQVIHIDNPVIHTGLETADVFLEKTRQSVENLWKLYQKNESGANTKLIRSFLTLQKMGLAGMFEMVFSATQNMVLQNLRSSKPSVRLFDFYKLYQLCKIAN